MTSVPERSIVMFESDCATWLETAKPFESVEEYIEWWVDTGRAARTLNHNFALYMVTVAYIFARWGELHAAGTSEKRWHFPIPWAVKRAFKADGGKVTTLIFDPLAFAYGFEAPGLYDSFA
jgi:hypothetical protein